LEVWPDNCFIDSKFRSHSATKESTVWEKGHINDFVFAPNLTHTFDSHKAEVYMENEEDIENVAVLSSN